MSDNDEIMHLQELISIYKSNIQKIEQEEAMYGILAPLNIINQKKMILDQLKQAQDKIELLLPVDRNHIDQQNFLNLETYKNYNAICSELSDLYSKSATIDILTSNGKSDVGHGSVFYNSCQDNKKATIRILISSVKSYYVSEQWAIDRDMDNPKDISEKWISRINTTLFDLKRKYTQHNLIIKDYIMPFTWRIWRADDVMFISYRFSDGRNDLKSPVLKTKLHDKSVGVFDMYLDYFERIWNSPKGNTT